MEEPGLGPLAIGALILSIVGLWGSDFGTKRQDGPQMIVLDRHKENCAGMAGFFGCKR